jgi:hypothetical protein
MRMVLKAPTGVGAQCLLIIYLYWDSYSNGGAANWFAALRGFIPGRW